MASAEDQQAVIEALMKARRREAHGYLKAWAQNRERIAAVKSTMGRIREMQEHAGSRSVPDREQTNDIEHACDVIETALRVERYVRMMPGEWVVVVVGVYLEGKTQRQIADQLKIERNRVVTRLQDAQDRLATEFEAQRINEAFDFDKALTSACKPVRFAQAAKLRPAA